MPNTHNRVHWRQPMRIEEASKSTPAARTIVARTRRWDTLIPLYLRVLSARVHEMSRAGLVG